MGDLFTVKLDLSAVTHDPNEKLYILMVDPTRMKMIYQFKLWVRFLFSIDCPIKLSYEGAAIHDLEDVHILVLLKTVRVECTVYGVGEREQREELMAKLNRYDEWCDSLPRVVTTQKQCEITNGDNFPRANEEVHHLGVSNIEGNEFNSSIDGCERRNENATQYPVSQKNVVKKQENCANDNLNKSLNGCLYNGHETNTDGHCNKTFQFEEYSMKNECSNVTLYSTPRIVTETSKNHKNKQQSSGKKLENKPFSIYNFLQSLRIQEANNDNKNKIKNDDCVEVENININSSDVKLKDSIATFEDREQAEQMMKKKRRRIRKHKNQKNKIHSELHISSQALNHVLHEKHRMKSVSVSPKPKHIRFDADGEDSSDIVAIKPIWDESTTMKDCSDVCLSNNDVSLCEKKYVFPSVKEDNFEDKTNSFIDAKVPIINGLQASGTDFKDKSVISDKGADKNESLSESPQSILDILESIKRKSNTPPVFDRFSNCM